MKRKNRLIAKAKDWKVYDEKEVINTIFDIYLQGMISQDGRAK